MHLSGISKTALLTVTSIHCLFLIGTSPSLAQPSRQTQNRGAPGKSEIGDTKRITIGMQIETARGLSPLVIQQWAETLTRLRIKPLSIRSFRDQRKLEITETAQPAYRKILVKGLIDTRGRLLVPNQVFTTRDIRQLSQWLSELRKFGPRGSLEGKPLWGLPPKQWRNLQKILAKAWPPQLDLLPMKQKITEIQRLSGLRIKIANQAIPELQRSVDDPSSPRPPRQLSQGTTLAYFLLQHHLAFTVHLTRDDEIWLEVLPHASCPSPWPVGWPAPSPRKIAPSLMEFTPQIEFVDAELPRVLEAIEKQTKIPFLFDTPALETDAISLADVRVRYNNKRSFWKQVIDRSLFEGKLKSELRMDESDQPFLWVSTIRSFRNRSTAKERGPS